MADPLRVLLIDDSLTSRQLLAHIINHSGDMMVIGQGSNGEHAVRLAGELQPDVVLMDIVMPRMDGLEATRHIMRHTPLPIVLVSASFESQETEIAFQALKAGALTVLHKPLGLDPADAHHLRTTVRSMAAVKVIHHYNRSPHGSPPPAARIPSLPVQAEIVAIAASTGGPAALNEMLQGLPADFPLPIVIVQHLSSDFMTSLGEWLQLATALRVTKARAAVLPQSGHVYLAPGDAHLSIAANGRFALDYKPGRWQHMPSCDVLLHSVAQVYGNRAIGIVLTGMGDDGADGLRALYEAGGVTITQDETTSVVYGMPQVAARRGAAQHILPLSAIARLLSKLTTKGAST